MSTPNIVVNQGIAQNISIQTIDIQSQLQKSKYDNLDEKNNNLFQNPNSTIASILILKLSIQNKTSNNQAKTKTFFFLIFEY